MLQIENLSVSYPRNGQQPLRALQDVSFTIASGEALGIVGESGCGKSTLARSILELTPLHAGSIRWRGQSFAQRSRPQRRAFRRQVQLIFQDPLEALNPRMTAAEIIAEPLRNLTHLGRKEITRRVKKLLHDMGLNDDQSTRYPHEFSGGQCQRIGIARAMSVEPELLVCDEPVSALDVSVQAQIINLLQTLRRQKPLALIFISHDLSIVRHISKRVLVLYQGQIMEIAPTETLFQNPLHPYTERLLAAIPDPNAGEAAQVGTLDSPGSAENHQGCPFYFQCNQAESRCRSELPLLTTIQPGHSVACHLIRGAQEIS